MSLVKELDSFPCRLNSLQLNDVRRDEETARQRFVRSVALRRSMKELFVTETDDERLKATANAVDNALEQQRRKESIQSAVTALFGVAFVVAILALIAMIPTSKDIPVIFAYSAPAEEEPPKLDKKELTNNLQPRPPGASSSMARVIASTTATAVSVPIPETAVPDAMIGMKEDFGDGFGSGDGDGSGGGGATFFGGRMKGKRIAFVVDFSQSMELSAEKGGSRISALKKELEKSINELGKGMQVTVIFFSNTGWTIETKAPNQNDKGWNGLGKTPVVPWYPATPKVKQQMISDIKAMPAAGGTVWYPGLKMALGMNPAPNGVFLLSDGSPRDGDMVLDELKEINPSHVPISTVAFELPGTPAAQLLEISEKTGGKFNMVYKGRRYSGGAAERFTNVKYDED